MSEKRKMIDKELYRKAYQLHQQHSEAKALERVRLAKQLSPAEAWRQFVALWEFCMKLAPPETELQSQWRAVELNRYYFDMQRFEAWRRARGETS